MTAGNEPPAVLPSGADDEYECVLVDPQVARAPAGGTSGESRGESLCPPGYVPRLKRRGPYRLEGKERISDGPVEQNPAPPPDR